MLGRVVPLVGWALFRDKITSLPCLEFRQSSDASSRPCRFRLGMVRKRWFSWCLSILMKHIDLNACIHDMHVFRYKFTYIYICMYVMNTESKRATWLDPQLRTWCELFLLLQVARHLFCNRTMALSLLSMNSQMNFQGANQNVATTHVPPISGQGFLKPYQNLPWTKPKKGLGSLGQNLTTVERCYFSLGKEELGVRYYHLNTKVLAKSKGEL